MLLDHHGVTETGIEEELYAIERIAREVDPDLAKAVRSRSTVDWRYATAL